jgi:hypothetical protein
MLGILADADIQGHVRALVGLLSEDPWKQFWTELNITFHTFDSLGLSRDASDLEVWTAVQANNTVLITGNRNQEGPDSLEATIRRLNRPDCLPVFTIAAPERVRRDRDYALRTALRLLEHLSDLEDFRGTGRIYLP